MSPPLRPDTAPSQHTLEHAWRRFGDYDQHAVFAQRQFSRLRTATLVLGVVATALAVIYSQLERYQTLVSGPDQPLFQWGLRVGRLLVILTPIVLSVLVAGSVKFNLGLSWVLTRASAETIKTEIYGYRARVGAYSPEQIAASSREAVLARQVQSIGERLMKTQVNQATLQPYTGSLPPPNSVADADDGFCDLDAEQYLAWRLENQLSWYRRKAWQLGQQLRRLQWGIYALGGLGTFLAAIEQEIWIAISNALVGLFATLLEFKQIESTLISYNQTANNLENILYWWHALSEAEQREPLNFDKLVRNTEAMIHAETTGWVQEMRDALADLYSDQTKPAAADASEPSSNPKHPET